MKVWKKAATVSDLPLGDKGCVKFGETYIAIVHYAEDQWYAVQNVCPHQQQNVLSRGLIGDKEGEPKIVCPLHKNAFSLITGGHLGGDTTMQLKTYPVKLEGNAIYIQIEE